MPSRPGHGPARRAPRRARLARAAVVLAVLTAAAVAAGYPGYVRPAVDDEQVSAQLPVDAIVALGGLRDTVPHAYDLAASGAAPVLVVSDPYEESTITYIGRLCGGAIAPVDGPEVVCFPPDPSTTRGEAREIARLAAERDWDRVAVMTPVYHVARARWIIERFDGELLMVATPEPVATATWVRQFGYQTAGWARALLQDGC